MCSVYGIFAFERDLDMSGLLQTVKNGKIYITHHAALLHGKSENKARVMVRGVLGDIYTLVRVGKSEENTLEELLNCYLKYGERCVDVLAGRISFFIYDEKKGRLFAARLKDSEEKLFYLLSEGILHISTEKENLPQGQKTHFLGKGESFVCYGGERMGKR